MFKILKSLSKSLGVSKAVDANAQAPAAKPGSLLDKVNKGVPATQVEPPKSAEELCGVTSKMSKEDIRGQLKLLFRRYNRSASSLNAKTRAEADSMLNAIVEVREKHFGEI